MESIDKITRLKVFRSNYWNQKCFGLNAQTLIDQAVQLQYIGALAGPLKKPTAFLALLMKLIQLKPQQDLIDEYLEQQDYKYLRVLAMFYQRIAMPKDRLFEKIDPYFNDNRKIRVREQSGKVIIWHVDQIADRLLKDQILLGLALGKVRRTVRRQSLLEEQIDDN